MSGVLVAVPAVPLVAALALVVLRSAAAVAARIAIIASAVAFAAAAVTLVAVGVDGPMSVVATGDDGGAIVGLAADRVGAILITLTTLVGLIVQSFASRSLRGDLRARRFHVLALVLTASTTVVAISATGTGFVVGWIATSVVLVALIGHRAPWPPAVAAQRRTGWSFLIGDSVLVVAMVVTLVLVGDIDLRAVGTGAAALDGEQIAGVNALTVVATLLVLAGIARSALVPIHRWLPSTLAAPTPVSALLHAGVINGAGVLLIRFSPVFASSATAMAVAFAIGMLTALLATAVMLVRTDVKGGLVWSTAGQMGFMVMQLGVGAFAAALFHIVGHAMYKAAMFLGAGGAISAHQRQQQRPHLGLAARTTLDVVARPAPRRSDRSACLLRAGAGDRRSAPHGVGDDPDRRVRGAVRGTRGERLDGLDTVPGHHHDPHRRRSASSSACSPTSGASPCSSTSSSTSCRTTYRPQWARCGWPPR